MREAEEQRARRDAEREKKWVAAEARKKAEEEACAKAEEEARKKAEEDEAKKKAEEEGRKQRQSEAVEKQTKTTMIRPMDPEPGMSTAGSTRSSEWVPGFLTPSRGRRAIFACAPICRHGFAEQCQEEWKAAAEYRENMTLELTGVRVVLQTMARAYLDDRVERQEASGSGLGVGGSGEALGSKKVVDPKGKGKGTDDLKGKKRVVDEEVDMDIVDEESDGDEEERDGEGDIEIV
ncbi:hypothetical protein PAXINDRAFT_17955 [Paxillus involutus ATCC 200175]|uniref:Uncharacterized protein n=1 Tax=Paxillus involutus ATCC 200175 TaxID=664439 RepID=A0A0C9T006_PAXIN|nr:hypothetical protein PAXINDRAFT_17955 [Paxillus involutus ATCC 200175]